MATVLPSSECAAAILREVPRSSGFYGELTDNDARRIVSAVFAKLYAIGYTIEKSEKD